MTSEDLVSSIDSNDLPAGFSSMVNLSPFHPDIMEQLFFILDLGLVWKMLPLTTYCFTGLHMHGRQAPMYKPGPRTDSTPYVQITNINYCPGHFYNNSAALSFIGNAKHDLLNIGMEMCNNALVSYSLNGLLLILMMISLNVLALRGWTGQPKPQKVATLWIQGRTSTFSPGIFAPSPRLLRFRLLQNSYCALTMMRSSKRSL